MHRVHIGLPVFNGANFVSTAIESILSQTFADFRLCIADNASNDDTEEICQEFARKDSRVEYTRNTKNVGAAENHNIVLRRCESEYFKWAAHDDVLELNFLEECVALLDRERDVVSCHSEVCIIDDRGNEIEDYSSPIELGTSNDAAARFAEFAIKPHACYDIFGVTRSEVIRNTPGIGEYLSADRVLLAELALHGKMNSIPERLFRSRQHETRSVQIPIQRRVREWWNPNDKTPKLVFPYWRLLKEYALAVDRSAPTSKDAINCYSTLCHWTLNHHRHLGRDIKNAISS